MSVERESDRVWLACDSCGETSSIMPSDEFQDLIDQCKMDGWTISRPNGHWQHHCDSCEQEESRLDQAKRKFGLK